jgi:hypothetical protein
MSNLDWLGIRAFSSGAGARVMASAAFLGAGWIGVVLAGAAVSRDGQFYMAFHTWFTHAALVDPYIVSRCGHI